MVDYPRGWAELMDPKIKAELEAMLDDLEYSGIAEEVRLVKSHKVDFDWGNVAKRLVRLYTRALREEMGEEAAQQFAKGLIAAVSN